MTDGSEQGAEVMDAAEEDTADDDPCQAGQPAEAQLQSGDGAGDGAGAGDGGEMMAHQNGGRSRNIVDTILHGMCGCLFFVFTDAPLLAQPAAIENITACQQSNANDENYYTIH